MGIRYDAIIVGAGPAGLSAGLVLGRCRRRVLVLDSGTPRNARARAMHGYLSRDGINPRELLRVGREQLHAYPSVELRMDMVKEARQRDDTFEVRTLSGEIFTCRKLLLATGVVDILPDVPGLEKLYGTSVHHCPYCDGWECRDQPVAVYASGNRVHSFAISMKVWTSDIAVCTDGGPEPEPAEMDDLRRHSIPIYTQKIARLEGIDGRLQRIVFADGRVLARRALFFNTGQEQQSPLAEMLGCNFSESGTVMTGRHERTHMRGLFVAGDASRNVQFVIVAAAEGAEAAVAINKELIQEDLLTEG